MNNELEEKAIYCSLKENNGEKYLQPQIHSQLYHRQSNSSFNNKFTTQRNPNFSDWSSFLKHCKVFCETTSLRGVPRIAKTSDPKRRFLWIFFVTAFFLACITCIVLLVMQYRQYDVTHQPKTVYNQPRSFPSLSFCNLRPLSSHSIKILKRSGLHSITEYLKQLKLSMGNLHSSMNDTERKLLTMSWNINSYFLNLPNSTLPIDLGHDRLEMVMTCMLVYKKGILTSGIACDKAGHWISTLNSMFLNCHTFIAKKEFSSRTFNMEIVLYLDNTDDVHCNDCNNMAIASQLTGIRLSLHSSGTYPEIIEKGINVMPGTLTEIRFIPREWSMMEPPHGKCSKLVSKTIAFNGVDFEYSEEACKKKVLQEELAKNCNCVHFNQVPNDLNHFLQNKKICKYLPASPFSNKTLSNFNLSQVADYLNKTSCDLETSYKINYGSKCNSPCTFFTYDTTISSAEWPTKSYHSLFLKSLSNLIQKRIKIHPNVADSTKSAWQKIIEELKPYLVLSKKIEQEIDVKLNKKLLNELKFVSNNFLSIQVSRQNFDIILVEEKASVSLTNFLSQTGGIFSIWSGITFFCIVELLELFILIFDEILSKKRYQNTEYPQNVKTENVC